MNDLTKRNNGSNLAPAEDDPFAQYAKAVSQTTIVGELLKFSKGDWTAGINGTEIEEGTRFLVNMDELLVGWIHWADMKPSEQIMGKVADRFQPPRRSELGSTDSDQWEVDDNGKPRDPWQLSNYILMQDEDGQLYTFTTSSQGGMKALGKLCHAYSVYSRQRPGFYPVVAIGTDSYAHSNKAYGRIKFPTLEVVGWKPKASFVRPDELAAADEDAVPGPASPPPPSEAKPAAKPKAKARF